MYVFMYVWEILSLYVVTAKYEVENFFQVERGTGPIEVVILKEKYTR
ncbi:histidinol dehydrogenase [Chryseobacterium camelliae]|nr:histidinol dehydrogenase [Chryseobacterium camelliae]